jgi:hypothetical protein
LFDSIILSLISRLKSISVNRTHPYYILN